MKTGTNCSVGAVLLKFCYPLLVMLEPLNTQITNLIKLVLFLFQHYSGLEEAVIRNIDACKELAKTTRSAYGPYGKFTQAFFLVFGLVEFHQGRHSW